METKENRITDTIQSFIIPEIFEGTKRRLFKFEPLAMQWLKNTKLSVKESTYVKYYNLVQNHIIPDLGKCQLERLTTEIVEQFVQKKASLWEKR